MVMGRRRWAFKGKAPLSYKVVFSAFVVSVFFEIGARLAIQKWSPTLADATHSYALPMHGAVYFVQPWIGKYLDHAAWVNGTLFGLVCLILLWHRRDLERAG